MSEFAESQSIGECALSDERSLRVKFSILPRYWLKIHFDDGRRCGLSQYFHINPGMHYPITTIRCFLRMYGLSDVGIIEEILKPALEAPETQWGLALKRYPDLAALPRIFFSIPSPLLTQVLANFVRFGYLSEAVSLLYLDWGQNFSAGESIFLSLDPTLGKLSALDFCDVPAAKLPLVLHSGFPERLDYLKLRISDPARPPELIAYMPFRKLERSICHE